DDSDHLLTTQTLTLAQIGTADGTFDGHFFLPPTALNNLAFGSYHFITRATLDLNDSSVSPESTGSSATTLFSPSYSAHAQVAGTVFISGDPVSITGTATSTAGGAPVPFADVVVTVTHGGVAQDFAVKTDAFGAFVLSYPSFNGLAGSFDVSAHPPDFAAEDAAPEDSFSLVDLDLAQSLVTLDVSSGTGTPGTLTLTNLSDQTLTGLSVDLTGLAAGWSLNISDLPATLAAHASTPLH